VDGVELVGFGCVVVLGHAGFLFPVVLVRWMRMGGEGMYWVDGWFCVYIQLCIGGVRAL
jgi:hypothetical protein